MMRSTPVSASRARMLRPSRPMIRPFISSLGSSTRRVVDSVECCAARRCIAVERMLRERRSASRFVSSSIARRLSPAWWRASRSTSAIKSCFACAAVRPEIRSSSRRWTRFAVFSSSSSWARFRSRSSSTCVRRSMSARWTSSDSDVRSARSSMRAISSRRARSSSDGGVLLGDALLGCAAACCIPGSGSSSLRRQGVHGARVAIRSSLGPAPQARLIASSGKRDVGNVATRHERTARAGKGLAVSGALGPPPPCLGE